MEALDRITHDPRVMGGKPTIRGMRVTVGTIVGLIGCGHSIDAVLADLPLSGAGRRPPSASLRRLAHRRTRSHAYRKVKIIVDMNLSPRWVQTLRAGGVEAEHWGTIGLPNAPDEDVISIDAVNARVRALPLA